jgi:hypothetical protein
VCCQIKENNNGIHSSHYSDGAPWADWRFDFDPSQTKRISMSPFEQAKAIIIHLKQQIATEFAGERASYQLQIQQLTERLNAKNALCNQLMHERMGMVEQLRDLQDDKMMLDWLNENNHHVEVDFPPGANLRSSGWAFYAPKDSGWKPVRERIRSAMRRQRGDDNE